ncbi:nucleoside hydrolase [Flammeovirga sp. OC4]|uniref:nucleoside hydrolase n=1 Tax=Flammeovirga sp. OC4 TaxID=1382345 RepID=UPI0005C4E755|nr:nucleoside hydrolase [Flammeovirga sp. OC4]
MKFILKPILLLSILFNTLSGYTQNTTPREKVIFDCDLGDDIDDMYALALLLSSPEIEIMGIVMDFANTPERGKMALKLLYELGLDDIPVVIGRKTSDVYSPQYIWSEGFNQLQPSKMDAVEFISTTLEKYPNEVNLVTVGPVPNMKDLLAKDPSILKKAKHIYSMFGSFNMGYNSAPTPSPEWNVVADIEASKAFIKADKDHKITYIPLDVTAFVKVNQENMNLLQMRNSTLTDAICANYVLWRFMDYAKDLNYIPIVYDAVAIGAILWPKLFHFEDGFVEVNDKGITSINTSKSPNSRIALHINEEEFLRRMMKRLLLQNIQRDNK